MTSEFEDLYEKAMRLNVDERQKLVRRLTESEGCHDSKSEIESDWNAEAARRYQDYKNGKVEAIPADEVFRRLEDRSAR
jgi:putative addiction module component (TIGR02574 family)